MKGGLYVLEDIKNAGDEALLEYTNKFEGTQFKDINEIKVSKAEMEKAYDLISQSLRPWNYLQKT